MSLSDAERAEITDSFESATPGDFLIVHNDTEGKFFQFSLGEGNALLDFPVIDSNAHTQAESDRLQALLETRGVESSVEDVGPSRSVRATIPESTAYAELAVDIAAELWDDDVAISTELGG